MTKTYVAQVISQDEGSIPSDSIRKEKQMPVKDHNKYGLDEKVRKGYKYCKENNSHPRKNYYNDPESLGVNFSQRSYTRWFCSIVLKITETSKYTTHKVSFKVFGKLVYEFYFFRDEKINNKLIKVITEQPKDNADTDVIFDESYLFGFVSCKHTCSRKLPISQKLFVNIFGSVYGFSFYGKIID